MARVPPTRERWSHGWLGPPLRLGEDGGVMGATHSTDDASRQEGSPRLAMLSNRTVVATWRRHTKRQVDEEGELLSVPIPLSLLWLVLAVLTVLEGVNDIFGVAGPDWLYDNWVHNAILGVCAVLVLGR